MSSVINIRSTDNKLIKRQLKFYQDFPRFSPIQHIALYLYRETQFYEVKFVVPTTVFIRSLSGSPGWTC